MDRIERIDPERGPAPVDRVPLLTREEREQRRRERERRRAARTAEPPARDDEPPTRVDVRA